jgi:hypothetical protein
MRNEHGAAIRTKPITAVQRKVEVIQDLQWEESIAAVKMAPAFAAFERFRDAIVDAVFKQPSHNTRWRYANSNFVRSFLPNASLSDPVIVVWKAFRDDAALQHVMRWQYVTSNPLVAGLVDGHLASANPGDPVDELVDTYLIHSQDGLNLKSRNRLRTNLRKIGLLLEQRKVFYRIVPEVSPRAMAVLLAHLFAPEPQVVSWSTLVADPWWKRLGIVHENMLREKLTETAHAGLIARLVRMDTLDQVTTRYSLAHFEAGKVRHR